MASNTLALSSAYSRSKEHHEETSEKYADLIEHNVLQHITAFFHQ
jgi:hypothetical protein